MESLNFNNNVYFGEGSLSKLSEKISSTIHKSVFIITDNEQVENDTYKKVLGEILKCKVFSTIFSDISAEPKINEVKNAFNAFKKSKATLIIAIGGGNVLDLAKAVSIIATNPNFCDIVSLAGKKENLQTPIDIIAIPTVFGSGSEVSKSLVLCDEVRNKKIICTAENILPKIVITDPSLMTVMSDIATLNAGFDALSHAIESLISKNSTLFTKSLANDAIEIIVKNLPKCYDEPDNIKAKENMAYASYMAALSYSNSGLGIAHSIVHAMCEKINIPHGIALAIVLPAVLKFNMYSSKSNDYKYLCEAFNIQTDMMSQDNICRSAIKAIEKFRNDFNIPKKLSDYGLSEKYLDIISLNAFEDLCTQTNPRLCNTTDIYSLLKKLI